MPEEAPPSPYFRGVMPNYLESVRDDRPFLDAEKDAWFNLLDVLNRNDLETLKRASTGRVTFVQLYRQSADYRGELVMVRGIVRWAHRVTAPKNEYGIKHYYQLWLTPDDNPDNLEVIYCLELPPGFPTGKELVEYVDVTGFYFKRWLYRARDTVRSAPVILAKTVEWQERPVLAKKAEGDRGVLVVLLVGSVLCAVLLAALVHLRTRRRRVPEGLHEAKIEIVEFHQAAGQEVGSAPQDPRGDSCQP